MCKIIINDKAQQTLEHSGHTSMISNRADKVPKVHNLVIIKEKHVQNFIRE